MDYFSDDDDDNNNNNNNNNEGGGGGGDEKTKKNNNLIKKKGTKRAYFSDDEEEEDEDEDDDDEEDDEVAEEEEEEGEDDEEGEEEDDDDEEEDDDDKDFINDDEEEEGMGDDDDDDDDHDNQDDDNKKRKSNKVNPKKRKRKASTAEFGSGAKKKMKKGITVNDKKKEDDNDEEYEIDDDNNNNNNNNNTPPTPPGISFLNSGKKNHLKVKKINKKDREKNDTNSFTGAKSTKKKSIPTMKIKLKTGEKKKVKKKKNNNNNDSDINKKKFKMDKKFYSQILFQIRANEEFTGEVKKKILLGCCNNNNSTSIDLDDIELDEFLRLNFFHQKNGEMICAEKPPPIRHKYIIKMFEVILQYFLSNEVDKGLNDDAKKFLHELKIMSKQNYEKMYYILLTYYYGFESFLYHNLTKTTFPQPEDPLIDFSRDSIPIHQISLNKRNNQKFNIKNDEKRFTLLKKLISIVLKEVGGNVKFEEVVDRNIDYLIVSDIKKTLNYSDPRIFKNSSLAGLVFCVSYLCDVILFGYRRLTFKNNI